MKENLKFIQIGHKEDEKKKERERERKMLLITSTRIKDLINFE